MGATQLTVVHRHECGLCEEMVHELTVLSRTQPLPPIEVVDVDADPQLQRRYGLEVPVLLLDGTVVCKGRLDREELTRLLRGHGLPAVPPPQGRR